MAVVSKATLKSYFEDGQEPDENKYINLIDTLMPYSQNSLHTGWMNFPGIVAIWNTHYSRGATNSHPNLLPTTLTLGGVGGVTRNRMDGVPTHAFASSLGRVLTIADNVPLSFSGAELKISANDRGFAVGGWFKFTNGGNWGVASQGIISKWGTTGNLSYLLQMYSTGALRFFCSQGGTTYQYIAFSSPLQVEKWYFCVGRFRTSTKEIEVYANGVEKTNFSTTASVFDSTANFMIGAYSSPVTGHFDGRLSGAFACGMHVSLTSLNRYYNATKGIFEEQGLLGAPPAS